MDERRKAALTGAGVDLEQALERMMGSEALLERLFVKFLEDKNYETLAEALASGDSETAKRASHTLKGMCGNLSMTELYRLFTDQVETIRTGDMQRAREMMEEIDTAYAKVCRAIGDG